mmetsp:Transcript_9923/g.36996  ORF Transcript_9923/g.36996 Transcript_9923/m.36996 type:complete len:1651 (-) Transcript_9923:120-5072(-)|eukprot:CAMPEP_0117450482 /NCGR_PEP_ID=MMETSP0759-20121206/8490_1 /TAXON_ID=63605 /ORGANISM="Percolomonas cosmopolitus, Strain WS" /LENGTH=1650 /DNA_ID=CAMNT_0005243003 /DNA_START=292 /DNA_END=5244 /DNA_ORIENTATION=-
MRHYSPLILVLFLVFVVTQVFSSCTTPAYGPSCAYTLSLKFSPDFKELTGTLDLTLNSNFTTYRSENALPTPSSGSPVEIPCYSVFYKFSIATGVFGWDPKCYFVADYSNSDNFRVVLGRESNAAPGSIISVLMYPFSQDKSTPDIVRLSSDISDSLKPVAVIAASSEIGKCSELFVDGSNSYFPGADLSLSYNWTIAKADGSPVVLADGSSLDVSQLRSAFVRVPQFADAPAGSYKISLLVTIFGRNNIGEFQQRSSSVVEQLVEKRNYAVVVPRIAGGLQQNVPLREPFTVFGSADLSTCYEGRSVEYQWFEQLPDSSRIAVSSSTAGIVPKQGSLLFANGINTQLSNRTFVLQINSSTPSPTFSTLLTETSVTLIPYVRDITVDIVGSGSGSRVVDVQILKARADAAGEVSPRFSLNATVTDLDDSQATKSFQWTVPAAFAPHVVTGSDSTDNLHLDVNSLYAAVSSSWNGTFGVTVTSTSTYTGQVRTASVSSFISFTKGGVALQFISPSTRINADSRFVARVAAQVVQGEKIERYDWSISGFPSQDVWKNNIIVGGGSSRVLALKPNTFAPGSTYTITATVHTTSGSSSASYSFVVNTPPSGGLLSSNPQNATVLETLVVSCDNYVDPDAPLQYSFFYKIGSTSEFTPISPFTASNHIEIPFPLEGSGSGFEVTIQARIRDSLNTETVTQKVIHVRPLSSQQELDDRVQAVKALLLKASEQRNILKMQVILSSLSKFIAQTKTPFLDSTARRELKTLLASQALFLSQLLSSDRTSSVSSSDLLFQGDIFQSITQDISEVSSSTRQTLSEVLNNMAKNNPGSIDVSNAQIISQTLSNLASSVRGLPNINLDRSEVTQRIVETTEIVTQSLSDQQLEGQDATTISTEQIKIAVAKHFSSSWSELSDMSVGAARAIPPTSGIGISLSGDSQEDTEADPSITVKMNVIKSNPFYEYGEKINEAIVGEVLNLKFSLNNAQSALPVADLSDPILIKIPSQNNMDRIEHDLSKAGDRPSCKFWHVVDEKWSSYGCVVHTYDASSTTCLCNHTTSFSAALEYALPDVNLIGKDELENLAQLNQDSMTTVIVVGVLMGLYFIVLVVIQLLHLCAFGIRKTFLKQHQNHDNDKLRGYIRPLIDHVLTSHIWLSVIWMPHSQSNFTRSMRLTVLMILILGSMGSNALTFGKQQANALQTILAAFLGDLLVTPFVLGFSFLFLKVSADNSMILNRIKGMPRVQDTESTPADSHPQRQQQEEKDSNKEQPRLQSTTNTEAEKDPGPTTSDADSPVVRDLPIDDEGAPKGCYSPKQALFDKADVLLEKGYVRYKRFTDNSILYGVSIFLLATLTYFAVIALGSFAIATAAEWMGSLGIMVFCCIATIAYFAFLEMIYLNTKVKRFKTTSMIWKGKITSRVGIAFGVGLLSILSAAIIACVFFMKQVNPSGFNWEYLFVIQIAIFGMMVMITIWMGFLFVSPKKKPKQGEKKKKSFFKRTWFPNVCKYPLYLLAWCWMGGMSFILVVYGVNFDIVYGPGTSLKWLAASSGSQAQSILLNKPLTFLTRFVVLTAIVKMFEFLFFRSQYLTELGEGTSEDELNSEHSDEPMNATEGCRRSRSAKNEDATNTATTSTSSSSSEGRTPHDANDGDDAIPVAQEA